MTRSITITVAAGALAFAGVALTTGHVAVEALHRYYTIDNAVQEQRLNLYRSMSRVVENERDYDRQFFFHNGSDDLDLQLIYQNLMAFKKDAEIR